MNSRADVNSDNRLIFGNRFDGNAMPIREIKGETGPIIIEGEVFSYEKKDIGRLDFLYDNTVVAIDC